jgi:hypothetical protein
MSGATLLLPLRHGVERRTLHFTWRPWKAEWIKIKHVEGSRRGSIAVCHLH